jgi:hypothetical protein
LGKKLSKAKISHQQKKREKIKKKRYYFGKKYEKDIMSYIKIQRNIGADISSSDIINYAEK